MRYLGVDLHANNFMVCFLSADGEQTFKRFKLSDIEAFKQCLAADDRIAVEATMTTRFFYTQVAPFVAECIVVNPSQFEVIKQSVKKTDQNDARSLAQFLSKGLLPSSRMKEELQAQIASLAQTRAKLVHLRTALLNKIHALVKSHGRESRKAAYDHEANLRKLLQLEWTVTERIELEVIAQQIRSLTDGIKRVGATDHEIKRRTRKGIETSRASKALALTRLPRRLSVIGDVNDFPDEDKLASYFGIVPLGLELEPNTASWQHHETRIEVGAHRVGAMHINRRAI